MKNKKVLIAACILTVIVGSLVFIAQKQITTHKSTVKVYIAKHDIKPGATVKKSDYLVRDINVSQINSDYLKVNDSILKKGEIVREPIYKGEIVNKKRFVDKLSPQAKALKLDNEQVEFSINVQLLDNYAGTYREGDKVTLYFTPRSTNADPNPQTKMLISEIKILGAIDSQGKFLNSSDDGKLATGLSFAGTKDEMALVANSQDKGTFKIGRLNPTQN